METKILTIYNGTCTVNSDRTNIIYKINVLPENKDEYRQSDDIPILTLIAYYETMYKHDTRTNMAYYEDLLIQTTTHSKYEHVYRACLKFCIIHNILEPVFPLMMYQAICQHQGHSSTLAHVACIYKICSFFKLYPTIRDIFTFFKPFKLGKITAYNKSHPFTTETYSISSNYRKRIHVYAQQIKDKQEWPPSASMTDLNIIYDTILQKQLNEGILAGTKPRVIECIALSMLNIPVHTLSILSGISQHTIETAKQKYIK